eukprot:g40162.t1
MTENELQKSIDEAVEMVFIPLRKGFMRELWCWEENNLRCLLSNLFADDPLAHLSEDMVGRAYEIFAIAFKYAVDMLTWVEEDRLPAGLEP